MRPPNRVYLTESKGSNMKIESYIGGYNPVDSSRRGRKNIIIVDHKELTCSSMSQLLISTILLPLKQMKNLS